MKNYEVFSTAHRREEVYWPQKRPGFVAWVTCFDYGNGSAGISFKETVMDKNPYYIPPALELSHICGSPTSYSSVEFGTANQRSYRVYMRSDDNGKEFYETGRIPLGSGAFCNVGFPDGRILGFEVPFVNEKGTSCGNYISVRESTDGGNTFTETQRLLEGAAPYLWRVKRLKDGTIVICTCLYGTPWGEGEIRTTRNTMLPNETYINKIQTLFITSKDDGKTFSEPHYILPGIGAHEYDFVELPNGSLLFLAGDVQATPVARQIVTPTKFGWLNGTLMPILKGAPKEPQTNPSGGYVPEAIVLTEDGLLVGSRRNKKYSCSNDLGENWFEIDSLPPSLYQPVMMTMSDGTIANFGHFGGDTSFGQKDMYVGADYFKVENTMKKAGELTLSQLLSQNNDHYTNYFSSRFTVNGVPVANEELTFRFGLMWNDDGSYSFADQSTVPYQIKGITNADGIATVHAARFDGIADIHCSYKADVVYTPDSDSDYMPCVGPSMCTYALMPYRNCPYPYVAYFAEGDLFLSPIFTAEFPTIQMDLKKQAGREDGVLAYDACDAGAIEKLLAVGVLKKCGDHCEWIHSVHAMVPLHDVLMMAEGDLYI